ncbi:hypothetical protein BC628DRAFT_844912 [Trametes gibbosa]|nr:hypothetical protein BC628DRAFT_844912 [Trametes gibbosa]
MPNTTTLPLLFPPPPSQASIARHAARFCPCCRRVASGAWSELAPRGSREGRNAHRTSGEPARSTYARHAPSAGAARLAASGRRAGDSARRGIGSGAAAQWACSPPYWTRTRLAVGSAHAGGRPCQGLLLLFLLVVREAIYPRLVSSYFCPSLPPANACGARARAAALQDPPVRTTPRARAARGCRWPNAHSVFRCLSGGSSVVGPICTYTVRQLAAGKSPL